MKRSSLLEQAKMVTGKRAEFGQYYNPEMAEVAVAWVNREVTLLQIAHAMGKKSNSQVYTALCYGLMYAIHHDLEKARL